MNGKLRTFITYILALLVTACQDQNDRPRGEYITRTHDQTTPVPAPKIQSKKPYFWEKNHDAEIAEITKECFRCKGNALSPFKSETVRGEVVKYHDCGGHKRHSLPLFNGKEGVYPVILDILNHIQAKTGHRVIITSGHRCPEHNTYIDPSPQNQYSKHQIGAEVDFYVQGYENNREGVLEIIKSFYTENTFFQGKKDYTEFKRYEKDDVLRHQPWMNKEIFIKFYEAYEGRNDDNRHPYPYIALQVRHDRDKNARVSYSWEQAFGNYLRY